MMNLRLHLRLSWSCFLLRFSVHRGRPKPSRARDEGALPPIRSAPPVVHPPAPPVARRPAPARPVAAAPPIRYCGFVAGFQHYDGPSLLGLFRPGGQLRLRRDRRNPHDSAAIRLYLGDRMVGYVERGPNEEIARRMDCAEPLVCRIEQVRAQAKPWRQIAIRIESLSIARAWNKPADTDDDLCFDGVSARLAD